MGLKQDLKESIKQAAKEVKAARGGDVSTGAGSVNFAGRVNAVIARNVGSEGETTTATSSQKVRIRQNGAETYEETETIEGTS